MSWINTPVKSARSLPNFLCVGGQRSGTSWLYKNLQHHPEIWTPPLKEIHYFDKGKPGFRKLFRRFVLRRLPILARQAISLDNQLLADLGWDAHFFLGARNAEWYAGLFRPRPGEIAGEVTPAYAILQLAKILEISKINPALKVIYIMRDPIERSWSAATNGLAKKRRRMLAEVPDSEIIEKLDFPGAVKRSDHIQVLNNWESAFSPEQVFVGFFDEVAENPRDLLLRIFRFLGVTESDEFISDRLNKKVNAAGKYKSSIPRRFLVHLAEQQIEQLRGLSARYGSYTTKWLSRAEETLAISEE